ncbi:phage tail protein, partial [Escherichia sp. MOD1-EC6098]
MILGFGNNVVSALAGDITTIQTDIPVMPGTGAKFAKLLSADFENKSNGQRVYAKITLTDNKESAFEICHLVSVSGDVLKVIRGQEGTTAKGWSLNDVVANFATRGSENYFVQIAQLQSGHYIAGVAGGTANTLTLELPSTFFVNEGTDWTLRTPIIVFPVQNNTNAATLQLTLGGKVLGTFPLYKGNKSELVANDIIKGIPLICLLDSEKSYFSVINPGNIYSDFDLRYVKKSGDLMTGELKIRGVNALRIFNEAFGLIFRRSEECLHLIPTSEGQGE